MTLLKRKPKPADGPKRRASDQPHPLRAAVTTLGSIAVVMGAVYLIEDRYAHAGDVVRLQSTIEAQGRDTRTALEINRLTAEVSVLQIRRGSLVDRLYDAGARQSVQRTPADAMIVERYRAELVAVDAEIAAKQRLIDRLKTGR